MSGKWVRAALLLLTDKVLEAAKSLGLNIKVGSEIFLWNPLKHMGMVSGILKKLLPDIFG